MSNPAPSRGGAPEKPVILDERRVRQLLPMAACVQLMEQALVDLTEERAHMPLRHAMVPPGSKNLLGIMPAYRAGDYDLFGIKVTCICPGNTALGIDSHQGIVAVFDGETGVTIGVVDASPITEIRTAAVSAVATRELARPESSVLALLGAGRQARAHLEALHEVLALDEVRVWSRTEASAQRFAADAAGSYGVPVQVAPSAGVAVTGADVVVTATSSHAPILKGAWLDPGTHVNAVGASFAGARELDEAAVAQAEVVVDSRASAAAESGDLIAAIAAGAITAEHIQAELGELLTGRASGRSAPDAITLFEGLGLGIEDLAAAAYVIEQARSAGTSDSTDETGTATDHLEEGE